MGKNIGEQIKDAIQDAIATQDFSSMRNVVERSIDAATASISAGLEQAQQKAAMNRQAHAQQQAANRAAYIQQQNEYFERMNQQRQELMAIQNRYAPAKGMKVSGYAMAIGGGVLAASFALMSLLGFIGAGLLSSGFSIGATILLALCGASIGLCIYGAKRAGFASRFQTYRRILGSRSFCTIRELVAQTGEADTQVIKDLRRMIGKGMFREGHLDDQTTTLMVTDEAYQQYEQALQAQAQRERQEQLIQGEGGTSLELTSEAEALLERGRAYLAKIRQSNDEIPDPIVSQKLEQTELILQSIFERAQEHPEVIADLEQLMNYYLPVTIKLLDAYEDLDRQAIQGENIQTSKKEIEETLDTLNIAFAKLLDSIFTDVTWDVSTDITVLHTVLAQEGLVNDPFDQPQEERK